MDSVLDRLIVDTNAQIYLGNYRVAFSLVYQADRRLVALMLGARTPERYDDLCYYQYKINAAYLSALYRTQREQRRSAY